MSGRVLVVKSWLQDYVDLRGHGDEKIAELLTALGHEVESVRHEAPLDPLIVVGRVLDVVAHQQADHLKVCSVDVGSSSALQIVCGADNVRAGMNVAVAQVGAHLPGASTPMVAADLRGVTSQGMICSAAELGMDFSAEGEGIFALQQNPEPGRAAEEVLGAADTVWDVAITPNRADCLGYIGLARDLAAQLQCPLVMPPLSVASSSEDSADMLQVKVLDSAHCRRFVALYVDRVQGGVSAPHRMQRRLSLAGIRPRSLIVDVTNYVLYEWAQPLHAYDYAALTQKELRVQRAGADLKSIVTLDGEKRTLHRDDLVICDGEKAPLALAGVMGAQNSWIQDSTSACVIEVADFSCQSIRSISKRHKLTSESSYRFARGVDTAALADVAQRAAYLLYKCSEQLSLPLPAVARRPIDHNPRPYVAPKVALRVERARKLLARSDLKVEQCMDILDSLECHLLDRKGSRLVYAIPSHRGDLVREVDLIEEIARVLSYDTLPSVPPALARDQHREEHPLIAYTSRCREMLAHLGLYEVILYPFTWKKDVSRCLIPRGHPLDPELEISNPLSPEFAYLQTTQVFALLRALHHNRSHRRQGVRFFQVGRSYFAARVRDLLTNTCESQLREIAEVTGGHRQCLHFKKHATEESQRGSERTLVSWVVDGPWRKKNWQYAEERLNFFHLKEQVERFVRSVGVKEYEVRPLGSGVVPFLHPGESAALMTKSGCLGYWGMLHPEVCDHWDFDLTHRPGVVELQLELLWQVACKQSSALGNAGFAPFPSCYRDLALALPLNVHHGDVLAVIESFPGRKYLEKAELFDLYSGDSLEKDQKSLAYALTFSCATRTLKDRDVDRELDELVGHLKANLGAERR